MTRPVEFMSIDRWTHGLRYDRSVVVGVGDDAAVLRHRGKQQLLMTTDMLVDGVHFHRRQASAVRIGRKALAVSLSDIAAMGGTPWSATVAAGIPPGVHQRTIDRIYRGMRALATQYDVQLVGGDTVRARQLALTVTLLGTVAPSRYTLRTGARVGHEVWVTGRLGGAWRTQRHLMFTPRIHAAQRLVRRYHPSAMLDISDGLASDVCQLTHASHVGCVIEAARVPRHHGATMHDALCDGEDFELLFTLTSAAGDRLQRRQDLGVHATRIGRIMTAQHGVTLATDRGSLPWPAPRFTHFST